MRNWLQDHTQRVVVNASVFGCRSVTSGVPQGETHSAGTPTLSYFCHWYWQWDWVHPQQFCRWHQAVGTERLEHSSTKKDLWVLVEGKLGISQRCPHRPESQPYSGLHQKMAWAAGQGRWSCLSSQLSWNLIWSTLCRCGILSTEETWTCLSTSTGGPQKLLLSCVSCDRTRRNVLKLKEERIRLHTNKKFFLWWGDEALLEDAWKCCGCPVSGDNQDLAGTGSKQTNLAVGAPVDWRVVWLDDL